MTSAICGVAAKRKGMPSPTPREIYTWVGPRRKYPDASLRERCSECVCAGPSTGKTICPPWVWPERTTSACSIPDCAHDVRVVAEQQRRRRGRHIGQGATQIRRAFRQVIHAGDVEVDCVCEACPVLEADVLIAQQPDVSLCELAGQRCGVVASGAPQIERRVGEVATELDQAVHLMKRPAAGAILLIVFIHLLEIGPASTEHVFRAVEHVVVIAEDGVGAQARCGKRIQ